MKRSLTMFEPVNLKDLSESSAASAAKALNALGELVGAADAVYRALVGKGVFSPYEGTLVMKLGDEVERAKSDLATIQKALKLT